MNLLEFIEQEGTTDQLSVSYKGEQVSFFVKNLTQAEVEAMNADQSKLLPIYNKQEKGQELSESEFKLLLSFQSEQAFRVLCDKDGNQLFASVDEMRKKIKGKLFKLISEAIQKDNKIEEAEKN